MKEVCARDPRRVEVYGFTRMGLLELSRERTGRSIQDRMMHGGKPSKLAVFSQMERALLDLGQQYEAVVLSLPKKWHDASWDKFDIEVLLVEGEPDFSFYGTVEECQNFLSRR